MARDCWSIASMMNRIESEQHKNQGEEGTIEEEIIMGPGCENRSGRGAPESALGR